MDIDETIHSIIKHRQAFAYGVEGVRTMLDSEGYEIYHTTNLRTNITDDVIHPGVFFHESTQNPMLTRATENRLGMQLIVGVGDAVRDVTDSWSKYDEPEIRFLRLIRNGAAHDNRLQFHRNDPRPGTEWRGLEIAPEMEGNLIFTDMAGRVFGEEVGGLEEGFMEAGDALALSTDILEILLPKSETYGPGNVIGLSEDDFSE